MLMVKTVRELAEYITSFLNYDDVKHSEIPDIDYGIMPDDCYDDLECAESGVQGWYGLKIAEMYFDSEFLILASDFYGGGALSTLELMDYETEEDFIKQITNLLLKTIEGIEGQLIKEDKDLLVETLNSQTKK